MALTLPEPHTETCAHCGRADVRTHPAGMGVVFGRYVCRPNVGGRPDCYRLVMSHFHKMPCTLKECRD
jgi:hypothetical protein